jgi:hypothetical protein
MSRQICSETIDFSQGNVAFLHRRRQATGGQKIAFFTTPLINYRPKSTPFTKTCQISLSGGSAPFASDLPVRKFYANTKSGYLAIVGIEDFRLKENNVAVQATEPLVSRLIPTDCATIPIQGGYLFHGMHRQG